MAIICYLPYDIPSYFLTSLTGNFISYNVIQVFQDNDFNSQLKPNGNVNLQRDSNFFAVC